jgi:hypothetical protein
MRVSSCCGLLLAAFLLGSPTAAAQSSDFGTIAISYRPIDAVIYIDGERWASPNAGGPVVVQLLPGRHNVEVRAPNHKWFSTDIDVRAGQSTPLNVSLSAGTPLPPSQDVPPAPPRASPPPPSQPGPIRQTSVAPSGDGWMIAPDFKITTLNHQTTGLAGVYGGAVFAGKLLVGAGAYWQLDSYYSDHLAYGGAVVEYRFLSNAPIGISAHGLAGYGQLWSSYGYGGRHGGYYGTPYGYPYEGFFVGEPQLQVVARFGPGVRLVGGVGYRFTTSDIANLDGVTGSFSIQFGR